MAEEIKHAEKKEEKIEEKKMEKAEENKEQKHEEKKVEQKITKKDEAIAKGLDLHASKKHCMYICSFIKGKKIDDAIKDLEDVIKLKKAVPYKGEIPHRRGRMMSGRYPVKTAKQMIHVLKALKGNVLVNGMDLDKTRIAIASANWASLPAKKGGARFKRSHVLLIAREAKK